MPSTQPPGQYPYGPPQPKSHLIRNVLIGLAVLVVLIIIAVVVTLGPS